jgi:hypothetical protein
MRKVKNLSLLIHILARRFSHSARVTVLAAMVALCAAVFASSTVPTDLDLLDRYLDRADGMTTEADWLAASREGGESVMAQWDARALELMDAGIDLASLRAQAGNEVEAEIERRLGEWLLGRFVGAVGDVDWVATLDAIGATKIAGIFELDDSGRVILDAAGDPVRNGIAGEEGFNEELEAWKASARGIADMAVAVWEKRATSALGELLSETDEGRRAELERAGFLRLEDLSAGKRRELDTLLALEESDYRHYRLTDQASLRLESEGEDASAVVAELIDGTNATLEATLAELASALDEEAGEVTVDGEVIDGDAWQEKFRVALENGLALWARSGEEFLARRIEWEQKAGVDLADGIERWNEALREMQEKESAWLVDLKDVRERAEARFDRRFEEIEAARDAAMSELDESIAANQGNLAERVGTMVEMLERSLGMMNTAREGAEYWIGAYSGNSEYTLDGISWDANALRAELVRVTEDKLRLKLESPITGIFDFSDIFSRKTYTESLLANIERVAIRGACNTKQLSPTELDALVAKGVSRGLLKDGAGYATLVKEYWQTVLNEQANNAFNDYMKKSVSSTLGGSRIREDALYEELQDVQDGKSFNEVLSAERIAALRTAFFEQISQTMESKFSFNASASESLAQATYWIETVYARYEDEAETQNEDLTKSYGLVVFEGKGVPEGGFGSDQTIAGPIQALLDEYGWEGLYLDDYQVELLKARAVSAYWEKELAVASAVQEYAVTNDYTRETEAETLDRYNASLASYSRALEDYRASVRDLEAVNGALDAKNGEIARIRERLETQKALLADQKRIYSALILSSTLDSTDYYTGQFRSYYEALSRLRADDSKEGSVAKAGKTLASAASARDADALVAASSEAIDALIDGDSLDGADDKGLVALRADYDKRVSFVADAGSYKSKSAFLEKAAGALSIGEKDATYAILESAYETYAASSDSSSAAELLTATLETVASTLALESAGAIERKMMAIRLLLADGEQSAYDAIQTVAPDAIAARSIDECATELADREKYAERSLFEKRLEVETGALSLLVTAMKEYRSADGHGNSANGFAYAKPSDTGYTASRLAWTLDRLLADDGNPADGEIDGDERLARAQETLSSLEMIKSILVDGALGEEERTEKLRELAAKNGTVRNYLAGGSVFSSGGIDYALPALADEYRELVALAGAADAYASYARLSPALYAVRRTSAMEGLGEWLKDNGLRLAGAETITLANAETIWTNFKPESRADALTRIATISKGARDIIESGDIPTSVAEGLDAWVRELETLLAAKALRDFPGDASEDASALEGLAKAKTDGLQEYAEIAARFLDGSVSAPVRAVAALRLEALSADLTPATKDAAIDSLAVSFCAYRLSLASDDFVSWDSAYDGWFASIGADDPDSRVRDAARERVILEAERTWELSLFHKDTEAFDVGSSARKGELTGLQASIALSLNSPESLLASFSEVGGGLAREALTLTRLESYLTNADPDAPFSALNAFSALLFGGDEAAATAYLDSGFADGDLAKIETFALLGSFESFTGSVAISNGVALDAMDDFTSCEYRDSERYGTLVARAVTGTSSDTVISALFYASLSDALASSGASEAERKAALDAMTSVTGITANPGIDIAAFAAASDDERALMGYSLENTAYRNALKRRIASGIDVSARVASLAGSGKAELERFTRIINAANGYLAPYDNELGEYLASLETGTLTDDEKTEVARYLATGSFDDSFFEGLYAYDGSKDYLDTRAAICAQSLSSLASIDAEAVRDKCAELSDDAAQASIRARIAATFKSVIDNHEGEWRACLGREGFLTNTDDAAKIDDTELAFVAAQKSIRGNGRGGRYRPLL